MFNGDTKILTRPAAARHEHDQRAWPNARRK
jgi:hypothetical protein